MKGPARGPCQPTRSQTPPDSGREAKSESCSGENDANLDVEPWR